MKKIFLILIIFLIYINIVSAAVIDIPPKNAVQYIYSNNKYSMTNNLDSLTVGSTSLRSGQNLLLTFDLQNYSNINDVVLVLDVSKTNSNSDMSIDYLKDIYNWSNPTESYSATSLDYNILSCDRGVMNVRLSAINMQEFISNNTLYIGIGGEFGTGDYCKISSARLLISTDDSKLDIKYYTPLSHVYKIVENYKVLDTNTFTDNETHNFIASPIALTLKNNNKESSLNKNKFIIFIMYAIFAVFLVAILIYLKKMKKYA